MYVKKKNKVLSSQTKPNNTYKQFKIKKTYSVISKSLYF